MIVSPLRALAKSIVSAVLLPFESIMACRKLPGPLLSVLVTVGAAKTGVAEKAKQVAMAAARGFVLADGRI